MTTRATSIANESSEMDALEDRDRARGGKTVIAGIPAKGASPRLTQFGVRSQGVGAARDGRLGDAARGERVVAIGIEAWTRRRNSRRHEFSAGESVRGRDLASRRYAEWDEGESSSGSRIRCLS